jgi:hypothetical protein
MILTFHNYQAILFSSSTHLTAPCVKKLLEYAEKTYLEPPKKTDVNTCIPTSTATPRHPGPLPDHSAAQGLPPDQPF